DGLPASLNWPVQRPPRTTGRNPPGYNCPITPSRTACGGSPEAAIFHSMAKRPPNGTVGLAAELAFKPLPSDSPTADNSHKMRQSVRVRFGPAPLKHIAK